MKSIYYSIVHGGRGSGSGGRGSDSRYSSNVKSSGSSHIADDASSGSSNWARVTRTPRSRQAGR